MGTQTHTFSQDRYLPLVLEAIEEVNQEREREFWRTL